VVYFKSATPNLLELRVTNSIANHFIISNSNIFLLKLDAGKFTRRIFDCGGECLRMVNLKPTERGHQPVEIVPRDVNHHQLLWLILVSIVIHGLGLLLFARYQEIETVKLDKTDLDPIEFTVLPEEPVKETTSNDKSDYKGSPNLKSAPTPAIANPPSTLTPPATAELSQREIAPTPEATAPPQEEQSNVLSGSDKISIPKPQPKPQPIAERPRREIATPSKDNSVATNIPPQSQPSQPSQPNPPEGVSNSASDLSGGDFSQTLASGGDAFFSPEALEYKSVLNPEQLKALKDIDLSKYLAAMEGEVKPNWNPSFRQDDRTTVLNFKIEKSGQVTGLKIIQSSGAAEADQEALAAVQQSLPFAPLPADFPLENLEITFSFNIHIY
jgi:periplasmic protein TonB